jgi:hypothetical protein
MTEAILVSQSANRARQTKFTPDTIRQIANLVERGKSRAEIAEIYWGDPSHVTSDVLATEDQPSPTHIRPGNRYVTLAKKAPSEWGERASTE